MRFKSVLAELARPDAQRADWLAWASNQLSHAFIGAALAGAAIVTGFGGWPGAALAALFYAAAKEVPDFARAPGWAAARDATQDALFVAGGALLVAAVSIKSLAVFALALAGVAGGLIAGVWQRVR